MKKIVYAVVASGLILSLFLGACAKPAPSPAPTGTAPPTVTPKAPPAPTPKASPTPGAPALTPRYGGVLKILTGTSGPRTIGYPGNISPGDGGSALIALESILQLDPKGLGTPWLATGWQIAPDGKSIVLPLRRGIKFHDGTDFNAEAAKWNLDNRRTEAAELVSVTSVDIVDDYTIRLNIKSYDNMVLPTISTTAGMQASPTATKTKGKEWAASNPVGTGPFKFVSWERGVRLTYERFDRYWQKDKPYLDGLQLIFSGDATTAQLAFMKGDGQLLNSNPKAANDLRGKPGIVVTGGFPSGVTALVPDSKNPDSPFADKRVREAVEYAIDKEGLVKALGYGFMTAATQIIPDKIFGYNPDIKGRTYNLEKAKQLLKDAGFPGGFKTKVVFTSTDSEFATAIIGFIKAVAIEAEPDVADAARHANIRTQGWKNGLVVGPIASNLNWNQAIQRHLTATPVYYASMVVPPEFSRTFFEKSVPAIDDESRKKALQQLAQIAFDEAMLVPVRSNLTARVGLDTVHADFLITHHVWWTPVDAWLSK